VSVEGWTAGFGFQTQVLEQVKTLNDSLVSAGIDTSKSGTGWAYSRYSADHSGAPNEVLETLTLSSNP
jgi:hypothetical protein